MKVKLHNVFGTVLGYRKPRPGESGPQPIYPIAGGADDDFDSNIGGDDDDKGASEDEDEDDEDDEDDDKSKKEDKGEWTPPTQEEFERLKNTAARRLKEKRALKSENNKLKGNTGRRASKDSGDKGDEAKIDPKELEAIRDELKGEKEESSKWRTAAISGKAGVALAAAGAKPNKIKALSKLLEYEDLDLDSAGELEGIEEQIEELKEDHPEFFSSEDEDDKKEDKKETTRRTAASRRARADAQDKGGSGKKELTGAEKIARSLLGRN